MNVFSIQIFIEVLKTNTTLDDRLFHPCSLQKEGTLISTLNLRDSKFGFCVNNCPHGI